ncbi:YafY family protein [Lacihabitans sp. CS3-21]|uniref:helix-turn-helix transcriptional regulator n=1 Tax=Lacihabitans sp. CS3-21 TaxID=2487332 RepID=UPI0020CD27BA|nr:WYL domain-containing protein [Lacihabitans sp. CS3-21]MCP9748794.1 WYL domain-containing protein [Lacihabitans sp. CS3-21]
MARNKALNLIRLLDLLSLGTKTKAQLAATLQVGIPQINRYFQELESYHLCIDEDENKRQFIFGAEQVRKGLLLEAEKAWLCSLVALHAPGHPFSQSIQQKLSPRQLPFPLPHQIKDANLGSNYEAINFALRHNLQIELHHYHSPTSIETNPCRLVEPIAYLDQHRQLEAYDPAKSDVRIFKIDRIGRVQLLETTCQNPKKHKRYTDAFGFSGDKRKMVKIRLSPLAKVLLLEEHPMARPYVSDEHNVTYFQGPICHPAGIGRFILGLPGHVKVLYGPELLAHLRSQVVLLRF